MGTVSHKSLKEVIQEEIQNEKNSYKMKKKNSKQNLFPSRLLHILLIFVDSPIIKKMFSLFENR